MTAPKTSSIANRAWQRMLSGRRLDLLDPSPLDIEIADIAHGLARVARWNGQTSGAHIFSVAQHTLLVEAVMREQTPRVDVRFRLAAMLHDAPEYVIGDMISPFKAVLGGDYKAVEKRVHVHDLHATILHLLGFDHTKLTYRHAGRDFRLTDVHGNVVRDILA